MPRMETTCAGCEEPIYSGDEIWVSDVGEEKNIITHARQECLTKYIEPEPGIFLYEIDYSRAKKQKTGRS